MHANLGNKNAKLHCTHWDIFSTWMQWVVTSILRWKKRLGNTQKLKTSSHNNISRHCTHHHTYHHNNICRYNTHHNKHRHPQTKKELWLCVWISGMCTTYCKIWNSFIQKHWKQSPSRSPTVDFRDTGSTRPRLWKWLWVKQGTRMKQTRQWYGGLLNFLGSNPTTRLVTFLWRPKTKDSVLWRPSFTITTQTPGVSLLIVGQNSPRNSCC